MDAEASASAPKPWPYRWIVAGIVVLGVARLVYTLDRATHLMWDSWQVVQVVGRVVGPDGTPVAGARVVVVVTPSHPDHHVSVSRVWRCHEDDPRLEPHPEDAPGIESFSHAAFLHTEGNGSINILLVVGHSGEGSLLHPAPGPPADGGVALVLVDAPGYGTAFLDRSDRRWTWVEPAAGPCQVDARLDLGTVILRPPDRGSR